MSLGWTVLVLLAVDRGGIAEAALYNVAMLVGVVLSAPVTGWLARRVVGRALLRGAAGTEMALRVGVLGGLVAGMPTWLIAIGVTAMHVAAWTGFAAMRAEVTAVDPRPRAMTRYALAIAAVEAAGTGVAALLPVGPGGHPTGWLLVGVLAVYGGSLVPTILSARRARVTLAVPAGARRALSQGARPVPSPTMLVVGGLVMLLASGPTLLAVPLTTELYSRGWVAGIAVAFSLGCLLSSAAVDTIGRLPVPTTVRWSVWGLIMLAGWVFAPAGVAAVLVAQFLCGLAMTALEGDMDARVAERAPAAGVTTALAYSAATRAMGGAVAVRALPALVAAPAIGTVSAVAGIVLAGAAAVSWTVASLRRSGMSPIAGGGARLPLLGGSGEYQHFA
jgi:hypothetical protein